MITQSLIDFASLNDDLDAKAEQYAAADPFPHIVIDGVLREDVFAAAAAEFPAIRDPFWKGYLHVNETKYANTQPDTWGQTLTAVAREFVSADFVAYLERLTGIAGLIADWSMDGGGLHQTLRGGHLNIHADFSTHHTHDNWARRVNILLYLNEEWREDWGGRLELWDKDMTAVRGGVTPKGNRMLVFTTSQDSFHGHPDPLTCPEDVARRSMALYYFTEESEAVRRSTDYRARPDDGIKKVAIWADKNAVDLYDRAKRRLGISDDTVQRWLARVDRLRRRGD
ncbi:proline hydroxylase [Intrasporangium oryzae NRRL B-24470]|uniref:Proline hydroxylase n=1 Tax=Intrasporangium oryzae NRRL B-24470 TaxID=1386089 RepID=W9GG85_9MICO|nr:2OG-Fe(II) oxygenase [Intrasporangium oryzae]EWT02884.1 proline hydroxylase [Intrasporangium oryzae NRRL B-24470]